MPCWRLEDKTADLMAANEAGMIDETTPAPQRRLDGRCRAMRETAAPARAAMEAVRAGIGTTRGREEEKEKTP
jgi:hypothetical protein